MARVVVSVPIAIPANVAVRLIVTASWASVNVNYDEYYVNRLIARLHLYDGRNGATYCWGPSFTYAYSLSNSSNAGSITAYFEVKKTGTTSASISPPINIYILASYK